MSVTTSEALQRARDANDSDAVAELEALLQYESEIDVAPYFYDAQLGKPETPAFVGMMDTVGDAIGGIVTPTSVGVVAGAANPVYNALTSERGITLPAEEGEKKGKKITGDEARNRVTEARATGQKEFETQRNLDVDKLQLELDEKTKQLGPAANNLQSSVDSFNRKIKEVNALTSNTLMQGNTVEADAHQQKANELLVARNAEQAKLDSVNKQIVDAQNIVSGAKNSQMSVAQSIDIDSQSLAAMGIEPPDVSKELQAGDIDGARKKISEVLEKNLQSKSQWMKGAVEYMKKNPGKAIPRALGKMGKATFTGNSLKKGLISGTAGGLLTSIGMGAYDALTGDYLSEEEAKAERNKFIELGRLAEQYRNPSRGEASMYLNPLIPEQKQVIDQVQQAHSDPNRGYLLFQAPPGKQ